MDAQLGIVEGLAHRLLERDLTPEEVETASSAAGDLAREFGLLELPAIARLARHLGSVIEADDSDSTTAVHIAAASEDIRTLLESAIAQQEADANMRGVVQVAGHATSSFDTLCWVLASRGFRVRSGGFDGDVGANPGNVVGAVVHAEAGAETPQSTVRAIGESWHVPVIVLTDSTDPTELRGLARHASVMLRGEPAPGAVATELIGLIAARTVRPTAVMCGVDRGVVDGFTAHGFSVRTVGSPHELLGLRVEPDTVVVFGRAVRGRVALDLTRVLRSTPAARRVPILWHHHSSDNLSTVGVAREGAMTAGVVDDAVIATLHAQLRAAAFDDPGDDLEGGRLLGWSAARILVDRSLVAAQRSNSSVALASLEVGSEIPDEGLARLAELFAREFRRDDIVCMRSDRNLVVALQGASRTVATNRMSTMFERFSLDERKSRVGVAVFPNDGRSAAELAVAADTAQALAAAHGGPAVVSTTWRPEDSRAVDVLIIAPEVTLTSVLSSAFEDRGLKTDECHDGRDAFTRLTAEDGRRTPRLLVLDLDTPGQDGLSLLRRLGSAGVLRQTSVLLMAARTTEADVRLALELGATDLIRKPFSMTLLLHRATRMLEGQ
ncbi:MAG: response regulator [Actinomycetota bacterium]